jgi:hypothetical protein
MPPLQRQVIGFAWLTPSSRRFFLRGDLCFEAGLLETPRVPARCRCTMRSQCIARADVPQKAQPYPGQFCAIFVTRGTDCTAKRLSCRATPAGGRILGLTRFLHANRYHFAPKHYAGTMPASIRFSRTNLPELLQMVITAAHVPAIVALIAGILILVMPRLLNFIVAIYLIFVGLVGMGLLRWLHL